MDVAYANDDLRTLCENPHRATQVLGERCARKLRARVADLKAVATVTGLPAGKPHPLTGARHGQYAIALTEGKRIVVVPHRPTIPVPPSGNTAWDAVTQVQISEIGNDDE